MLLTFKNLQQQSFQIEIDTSISVKDLKAKIASEKGEKDYPPEGQKLIYAGKVMEDSKPVSEYNVDDKKFIVVMVVKAKPAPAAAPAPTKEAAPSAEEKKEEKKEGKKEEKMEVEEKKPEEKKDETSSSSSTPAEAATSEGAGAAAAAASSDSSGLVMGEKYEETVQQLVDMGYEKPKVIAALKASFNNPDRAVEYLISGIPNMDLEDSSPSPAAAPTGGDSAPASADTPASGGGSGGSSADTLGFLRNQPQFQQMRQILQANPNMLNVLLQQIGQSNPQLLELISQNQEAFIRMINEPEGGASPGAGSGGSAGGGSRGGAGGGGGPEMIQVSPQEKEAIERLKALGFPEHLVVQAYFACEKNEELAANFLLSQGFDD